MANAKSIGAIAAAIAAFAGAAHAFDARSPADVAAVLAQDGASAEATKDTDGSPYVSVKAGNQSFDERFWACDDAKTRCDRSYFIYFSSATAPTEEQINRWNRWTVLCPAYLSSRGAAVAWFAVANHPAKTEADVRSEFENWLECLKDFDSFTAGPDAFLQSHNE